MWHGEVEGPIRSGGRLLSFLCIRRKKERKEGKKKNNYGNVLFIAMTGNIWCNANLGSGFVLTVVAKCYIRVPWKESPSVSMKEPCLSSAEVY